MPYWKLVQLVEAAKDLSVMNTVKLRVSPNDYLSIITYMNGVAVELGAQLHQYSIEDEPKGEIQKGDSASSYGDVYVDQGYQADMCDVFQGTVSIPIDDGQYLQFHYSM